MRALLLALLVSLGGCGGALADATRTVNATGDVLEGAHGPLKERHQRAELQCVEDETTRDAAEACVESVRERYVPVWDSYDAAREAWLLAAVVIRELELVGAVGLGELMPALGRLGTAVGRFKVALARLEAP